MSREPAESDVFVLLAKRRRRIALRVLQESTTPISAMELARRIGDRESDPSAAVDTTAVFLTLYHNHLPRLADADVVEYDRDEGTVYPGLNFDTLVRVLERADHRDLPWADE